jgi:predicted secreted protein
MFDLHLSMVKSGAPMAGPPLQPPVADRAPDADIVTRYDYQHYVTYLRLLDAAKDGADWREVAKIVLHLDPAHDEERAKMAWESHLARARWLAENYRKVLWRGEPQG